MMPGSFINNGMAGTAATWKGTIDQENENETQNDQNHGIRNTDV
jgi:hypothetical protein